jgi:hypothetical protein
MKEKRRPITLHIRIVSNPLPSCTSVPVSACMSVGASLHGVWRDDCVQLRAHQGKQHYSKLLYLAQLQCVILL